MEYLPSESAIKRASLVSSSSVNLISHTSIEETGLHLSINDDMDFAVNHHDGSPALYSQQVGRQIVHSSTGQGVSALAATDLSVHENLGHPGRDAGFRLAKALGIKYTCVVCTTAKARKNIGHSTLDLGETFFDILHIDIVGGKESLPKSRPGLTDSSPEYYMIIVDGATRYIWIKPLYNKKDAYTVMEDHIVFCKTQYRKVPKRVHCDKGGELTSDRIKEIY